MQRTEQDPAAVHLKGSRYPSTETPMQIDPETMLQELGRDFSKARRLFRRLGVELESASEHTVAQACELAGISVKDFARTLQAMTPESGTTLTIDDWAKAPLRDLISYIQDRHHVYTRQELIRLGRLLEEAVTGHGEQHPELLQIRTHFHLLREDLLQHLDAEDRVIFPSILNSGTAGTPPVFATLDDLYRMAMKEHEAAEELFQNIGILTHNFALPLGAAPAVRALYLGLRDLEEDLFMHIYLENHVLFPRATQSPGIA
jgi:regulator of cell morphogenesis and NO signaling